MTRVIFIVFVALFFAFNAARAVVVPDDALKAKQRERKIFKKSTQNSPVNSGKLKIGNQFEVQPASGDDKVGSGSPKDDKDKKAQCELKYKQCRNICANKPLGEQNACFEKCELRKRKCLTTGPTGCEGPPNCITDDDEKREQNSRIEGDADEGGTRVD